MFERFDKGLLLAIGILTIFGLIMISSISIAGSFEVTGENDFYFWRHFWYMIVGIPVFLFAMRFPLERMRQWSTLFYLFGISLIIMTLVNGENYGTAATLWLRIGPFSFQPVEVVKLAVITFLAALFSSGKTNAYTLEGGFIPFAIVLGIPSMLLVIQSDFGSLLVLTLSAVTVYIAAGATLKHLIAGASAGGVVALIAIFSKDYILHRIKVFLNPDLDPLNAGFQIKQALIAIGSGGIFGRGFQNSIQKYDYLPEVQSDTIFAAISEEMGFFRVILILGLYLFIAYRGFFIAKNAPDKFSQFLAIGITTWFVGQAFINIGVNMALLPNTGITLPLLSYGGTSLVISLASLGILVNISGQLSQKKKKRYFV